jgi:hypothetical protein
VTTLAAVAAYALSAEDAVGAAGAGLAGVGTLALATGIVLRLPFAIPWAVLLAGAGYVLARVQHSVADGWAAVVGAALLLAAELAAWSIATDRRIHEERVVVLRRSLTVAGLVVGAALVSFILVGAAAVSATTGLVVTGLGVAASVGAVTVILRLVR